MSTEQRESQLIRSWLEETYAAERDERGFLGHLLDEVATTPQRRRSRWHLLRPGRGGAALTAADTVENPHSPASAGSGHSPTITRRTQSMLNPVTAITAAAFAFALGGVMLIAQPFSQQGRTPAAEVVGVSTDPAWVTGTLLHAPTCTPPERTAEEGVVRERGYRCGSQIWETDDARLSGRATPSWNADVYRLGPDASVSSGTWEVEAGDGAWLCLSGPNVGQGSGLSVSTQPETITCTGQDAFSGLMAVLDVDVSAGTIAGLVFPGEAPPRPGASGE